MAAAEARAAWQRTANRCFVQEDAKRAPKLACVPPAASSSSLFKQADTTRPTTNGNGNGNGVDDLAPPTANSMYSNLSSDSRWWLHLQPNPSNYMYQKEQVSSSTLEFVDIMDSQSSVKGCSCNLGEESYEFVEMDSGSKQVDEFSLGSEFPHWMERENEELPLPWWHKDDLASFVAQRSQDFMENCDLPQPQSQNTSFTCFGLSKPQNSASVHGIAVSPLSTTTTVVVDEGGEMDPSKRKLLEALCHSQTRAREAEKAAKQAYEEKQHVVKLIFKQASQLFAYKQWLYLLQLENLYNQIKANKIPSDSPWNVPPRKKPAKRKTPKPGYKDDDDDDDIIGKYAVAFAVGLGLVGAGLLLGWTVGWMFII
ncbi:unnamed protein product [Lactuca virosa]|uniref:Uncharacterized protein n=1 Tax=Lactuca virosa TaxID=75947 RepID=A0AAU9PDD5_9ASTR|nr:unnamed protein product [Lactuca virosa]